MLKERLARWKSQLSSNDIQMQLTALAEIVDILNNLSDFSVISIKEKYQSCVILLINSDICFFIADIISYQQSSATRLINIILCHLSKMPEFFKTDFTRITRGYLRLLNSFPTKTCDENVKNLIQDALTCLSIIFKRTREHDISLQSDNFPLKGIFTTLAILSERYNNFFPFLEVLNFLTEELNNFANEEDRTHYVEKLSIILKNLKINAGDLNDVEMFLLISKTIVNAVKYFPSKNQTAEERKLVAMLMDKAMVLTEFIIKHNQQQDNFEIFCSFMYYILAAKGIRTSYINNLLSHMFRLNGLSFLIDACIASIDSENYVLEHKSRVVVGLMMYHVLKSFLNLRDNDKTLPELKSKYMKIAYTCDFKCLNDLPNKDVPLNSMMMIIFNSYINLKWNKVQVSKGDLLSSMALILTICKAQRIEFDKGLLSLLIHLFTYSYVPVKIKGNDLVQRTSNTIMKYKPHLNLVEDLNFLKWWHWQNVINKTDDLESYEKAVVKFINSQGCSIDNLSADDLVPFNLKLLIDYFFDEKTEINRDNLAKLISKFPLKTRELEKFLRHYEQSIENNDCKDWFHVLTILNGSANRLTLRLKKKTGQLALEAVQNPTTDIGSRMLQIQLAIQTMKRKNN